MKFGRQLELSWVPVWKEHYVDYKLLKKMISRVMVAQGLITLKPSMSSLIRPVDQERAQFAKYFLEELDGIDLFYGKLRAAFADKLMRMNLSGIEKPISAGEARSPSPVRRNVHAESLCSVQIQELIKVREELRIWREYVDLNYTAARKILKKYDKRTSYNSKEILLPKVQKRTFYASDDIDLFDFQVVYRIRELLQAEGKSLEIPDLVDFELKGELRERCMDRISDMLESSEWVWYGLFVQVPIFYCKRALNYLCRIDSQTYALMLTAAVIVQVIMLYFMKFFLQYNSQYLTMYLRNFENNVVEWISDFMHHKLSTGNWFLLCCSLMWLFPSEFRWKNLYCFVGTGFVIKSLAKSYLRSPRGFWLWTEGSGTYCGKGWSLPSGHAMVSLCLLSFLVKEVKSPAILLVTILFEIAVFLNVTYIGTHTYADVIVGWTFALWFLSLYGLLQKYGAAFYERYLTFRTTENNGKFQKYLKRNWAFALLFIAIFITICDYLEELSHPDELPDYFQTNMEKYCGFEKGKGLPRMRLRLKWTNIPLILGMASGYALYEICFMREEDEDPTESLKNSKKEKNQFEITVAHKGWQKLVLFFGGAYIFMSLFSWCKIWVQAFSLPMMTATYLHNFLSPFLVLFLWPYIFGYLRHVFGTHLIPAFIQDRINQVLDELSIAQLAAIALAIVIGYNSKVV